MGGLEELRVSNWCVGLYWVLTIWRVDFCKGVLQNWSSKLTTCCQMLQVRDHWKYGQPIKNIVQRFSHNDLSTSRLLWLVSFGSLNEKLTQWYCQYLCHLTPWQLPSYFEDTRLIFMHQNASCEFSNTGTTASSLTLYFNLNSPISRHQYHSWPAQTRPVLRCTRINWEACVSLIKRLSPPERSFRTWKEEVKSRICKALVNTWF